MQCFVNSDRQQARKYYGGHKFLQFEKGYSEKRMQCVTLQIKY